MLILCIQPPDQTNGFNFWHIPAFINGKTIEEEAELVDRVMKRGDIYFDDDDDDEAQTAASAQRSESEDEARVAAAPGAFDEAAAEYNAERANARPRRGAAAVERAGGLDELDEMEMKLASRGASEMDGSSSDDDADASAFKATMRPDKEAASVEKKRSHALQAAEKRVSWSWPRVRKCKAC